VASGCGGGKDGVARVPDSEAETAVANVTEEKAAAARETGVMEMVAAATECHREVVAMRWQRGWSRALAKRGGARRRRL
jgi:hypothetical protein